MKRAKAQRERERERTAAEAAEQKKICHSGEQYIN